MKKKLPIIIVAVIALAGAYKFVLAKPKVAEAKPKVEGTVYILQKEFLINLADGKYAKLSVGLLLDHKDTSAVAAEGHGAPTPPEGYGAMGQEAVVRDQVTNILTDSTEKELVAEKGREHLKEEILTSIKKHTDVKADEVLFMDVTVQ
jgi:flagellar FliL protein